MGKRKKGEEEQIQIFLFSCQKHPQIRDARTFSYGIHTRCPLVHCTHCTLQRIRTHCFQPHSPYLPMGQQPACMDCRARRKLCLLQHRGMGEVCLDACHISIDSDPHRNSCMEERKDMVQYDMSGGHDSGILLKKEHHGSGNRHRKVPQLRSMRQAVQGIMHRYKGA